MVKNKNVQRKKSEHNAGVAAQKGFHFQHYYSLHKILQIHSQKIDYKAIIEGDEDLDIYLGTGLGIVYLYQMKTSKNMTKSTIDDIVQNGIAKIKSTTEFYWHLIVNSDNNSSILNKINTYDNPIQASTVTSKEYQSQNVFILKTQLLSEDVDKANKNLKIINGLIEDVFNSMLINENDVSISDRNHICNILLNKISNKSTLKDRDERCIFKQDTDFLILECLKSTKRNSENIKTELKNILQRKNLDATIPLYLKEYDRFKEQILQRSPDDSNYIQIKNAVRDIICNNLEDIYNNITELDNISYFTQVTESNAEYMNRIGINKDDLKMLFIEEYIRTRL